MTQLGIDIGGTTVSLGLVRDGSLIKKVCLPSFAPDATKQQTLDYLASHIAPLLEGASGRGGSAEGIAGIGFGVPSVVDVENGIVYNASNIPSWDEVPLKDFFQKRFGIPVAVNNDSNCFALGAAHKAGYTAKVVAGITLGTGTGVGVVVDGRLLCGPNCGVGEIGAAPYLDADYESYCSKKFFENRGWNGKAAFDQAQSGNSEAIALFQEFGRHLGEFIALVLYAYDADCIILGGGLSGSFGLFKDAMESSLRARFIYPESLKSLRILAMPQEEVALLGAAMLSDI